MVIVSTQHYISTLTERIGDISKMILPTEPYYAACTMSALHVEFAITISAVHVEFAITITAVHVEFACTVPYLHC